MKNSEFIALLAANTNKTTHIRTYAGTWYSGVSRVPDEMTTKIGKIVALIQAKINEGQICKKDSECLLVYNFQPGTVLNDYLYCHIDMLIKPIADIHHTGQNVGRPLQLAVDGHTGEIANSTKSMIDLGLMTKEEAKEEGLDAPVVYGSYKDFKAICCFAALASYKPITNTDDFFKGKYDAGESVKHSVPFDSWVEARKYLANRNELGRYIFEITTAKEDYPTALKEGVSKQLLKVINYFDMAVQVTPISDIRRREDKISDELERIAQVKHENSSPMVIKKINNDESNNEYQKESCSLSTEKNQSEKVNKEEDSNASRIHRSLSDDKSSSPSIYN